MTHEQRETLKTGTRMTNLELTELLYDALRSPFGTVIETEDPERLRQQLYPIRKGSEDFTQLSFIISPINGMNLWIVNKGNPSERDDLRS